MDKAGKAVLRKEIMQKLGLTTKEEAVAKAVSELTDRDKIKMMTNLAPGEDSSYATLDSMAYRYDLAWLQDFVDNNLELRMSVGGWKSNQLVTVATEKMKEIRQGLRDRILRRGNGDGGGKWKAESFE